MPGPWTIFISHPSAFLTDCRPNGDGLAAWAFIQQLAARGHRLEVAVGASALHGPLPAGVHLHPIAPRVPFSTLAPLEYALRVRRLYDRLARERPIHLIQQLNPVEPGLSGLLVGLGPPVLLGLFVPSWPEAYALDDMSPTVLGRIGSAVATPVVRWLDARQQRGAAGALLSTEAARARLHSPPPKTWTLPYGVDAGRFVPGGPAEADRHTVLFVASLEHRKGVWTLLEAFTRIAPELPHARLRLIGDGSQREALQRAVAARGLGARVEITGHREHAALPGAFQSCAVFCLPSHGEPFGLSALEAMACGRPVVSTTAGGLGHLVPDDGGRKVPPGDDAALAEALRSLLSDPDARARMGRRNREEVERTFAWERVIDRLEAIYDEVLSARR